MDLERAQVETYLAQRLGRAVEVLEPTATGQLDASGPR